VKTMRLVTMVSLKIRTLFRSRQVERELTDELQFHIEHQTQENRSAGMNDQEARYAALQAMGGITQIQEECREARGLNLIDDLRQDLRYAIRVFRKSPGFSIVAITTLAIGIGANTAAFSVVNAVLLRPLPLPFGERVASIQVRPPLVAETGGHASPAQFLAWRANPGGFDLLAAVSFNRALISSGAEAEEVRVVQASAELQALAGVHSTLGRDFQDGDFVDGAPSVCLVSLRLCQRRFSGDRNVIGRTLYMDARPTTIVGVLPADIAFPDAESDIWTTLKLSAAHQTRRSLDVYGRLRPGVGVRDAQAWLNQVTNRTESELPDWLRSRGVTVTPIREQVISDQRTLLVVLSGIAICVLLVCCANIGNLLLARHLGREREIALRASIGATRWRMVRQLLTEALLLCFAGTVIGFAAGRGLLSLSSDFLADSRFKTLVATGNQALDARVAIFAFMLLLSTAILFGLIPLLHFRRVDLNAALKSSPRDPRSGGRGFLIDRYLIALELSAAFILLAAAGLLTRSFVGILTVDRGYSVEHLLTARFPVRSDIPVTLTKRKQVFEQLTSRLAALPNVGSVGVVTGLPLGGLNATVTLQKPGQPFDPENLPWAGINCVSPDYFRAMGIPVVRGRGLDSRDSQTSMKVAVVNETLARQFWPDREAIGQELMPGIRVVGVVRDIRQEALDSRQGPAFYLPFEQRESLAAAPNFLVIRTHGNPMDFIPTLKAAVRSVDPLQPLVDIQTMEDVLSRSIAQRRLLMSLMAGFAALATILSIAGIYGVFSYLVANRTREIGIRICLGAQYGEILALVARQLFIPVAAGLVGGFAVSLATTRVLSRWLFSITANDPMTLIGAAILTVAIGLFGGIVPAIRALRVDPISAVRTE
jgi:putative ABC transport system permease protein